MRDSDPQPPFMKIGILVTGTVIAGMAIWFCHGEIWSLRANEIGDWLAGAVAFLAFLWFILTALMQREELQLQRRSHQIHLEELSLQRQELSRLTEAVERSSEQAEQAARAQAAEREAAATPRFAYVENGRDDLTHKLTNLGGEARDITCQIVNCSPTTAQRNVAAQLPAAVKRHGSFWFQFRRANTSITLTGARARIRCTDLLGTQWEFQVTFEVPRRGPMDFAISDPIRVPTDGDATAAPHPP